MSSPGNLRVSTGFGESEIVLAEIQVLAGEPDHQDVVSAVELREPGAHETRKALQLLTRGVDECFGLADRPVNLGEDAEAICSELFVVGAADQLYEGYPFPPEGALDQRVKVGGDDRAQDPFSGQLGKREVIAVRFTAFEDVEDGEITFTRHQARDQVREDLGVGKWECGDGSPSFGSDAWQLFRARPQSREERIIVSAPDGHIGGAEPRDARARQYHEALLF